MIRTRFAPSPTGYLHVGGARTALYCWLFSKNRQGKFILRIEDTDRERSTQAAIDAILEAMQWLGLHFEEGPFYQMQRLERYQTVTEQLLNSGHAYRCYCSKERLEQLREERINAKQKPRYDGFCRDRKEAPEGMPYVVRFRNPDTGQVDIDDCIHGRVVIQNSELDDLILVRTDGVPTYNFGVVVDDLDMEITHVIRGDDHLANTPRQVNIFKALGKTPPIYAHIPMILGSDGKRLSKRHGAVSVQHYRDEGILPQALLNYLVRLGWSHGDQEIFSLDEMIEYFDLKDINKSAAAFNTEKLLWLNQHYLKTLDPKTLQAELAWHFKKMGIDISETEGPALVDVIAAQCERAKTLKEMAEKSLYFYQDDVQFDLDAQKNNLNDESLPALHTLYQSLKAIPVSDWNKDKIHQAIKETADHLALKLGKLAQPLRVAMTGNTISPPIDSTLELIGRTRVLKRLERILPKT